MGQRSTPRANARPIEMVVRRLGDDHSGRIVVTAGEESVFNRRFDNAVKLTDSVYEEVKQAIVELKLRPGDMLREAPVAKQLGISKTPVREALLQLKQDGLVELVPYKGAMITGYDVDDVREIFELRAMIESECVRHAASENDEGLVAKLNANVEATRTAIADDDIEEVTKLFDEFDAALFSRLKNRRLQSLIENLQLHMKRIGKLTTEIPGRVNASVDQHARITKALADGDPLAAQKEMRDHIASVLEDEIEHMELRNAEDLTSPEKELAATEQQ